MRIIQFIAGVSTGIAVLAVGQQATKITPRCSNSLQQNRFNEANNLQIANLGRTYAEFGQCTPNQQ